MSVFEKMTAIADAIRAKTGGEEALTLDDMATDIPRVYNAGEQAERDAQWNAFWDTFQVNGTRKNYQYAFSRDAWSNDTFKPKYDIVPTSAAYMFAYNQNNPNLTDIKSLLEQQGVVLDTSKCTNMESMFYVGTYFTRFPAISFESCTELKSTFYNCHSLQSIDKVILKSDGTNTFNQDSWSRPFGSTAALKRMIVEGVIGKNGFYVDSKKLDKESITSIINALSATTTGLTVTLSLAAKNAAFTVDEWAALIATKPNWTISLV